jgi:uncharacterized protein YkwD
MKINKSVAVALAAAILASGGGMTSALITAQPAQASSTQPEIDSAISQILSETNAEREKAGLGPLTLDPTMSKVSQNWSQQMAAQQSMIHNPSYTSELPQPWIRVAENVGQGYTPSTIVPAWMASPGHAANILGSYTHIGIGYWVDETGRGWFTQNFGKYEQPVLTELNEPVNTAGKFEISSSWLAKWDEIPNEYLSELYSSTGVLLQSKVTTTPDVTFTGLTANTNYTVRTTARIYNALKEVFTSPTKVSNVTTLEDLPTVSAPTDLTLKAGEDSVEATWTPPANVYGTLAPYDVELKSGSTVVKTVQTIDPYVIFSGLTSNTDYTINVTASSSLNGKTVTATATQTQKTMLSSAADVSEVKNLAVTADSATSVKATWDAPDQKIGVGLKYILTLSSAGKPDVTAETTSTSYTFAGVASETAYTVKIQAFIASENSITKITTAGVTGSAATAINYDGASANAPTLKPVLVQAKQATLNWTAPTSVVGKLVDYTLTVKQQGQPDRVFKTNLDNFVVTGLTENTAYMFELKANITSLNGKNSASSTPTTSTNKTPYAPSTAIAGAPRSLTVTAVSYNQINASWTPPANVVGIVTGYKVTVRSGDFHIETRTVTGLTTRFTGLADSGYYTVEVSAIVVSPDKTNTVTSTLVNASDVTPAHVAAPNAPATFKVASAAYNEATLTWGAPAGVYGDLIDYTVTLKEPGKADRVFKTSANSFKVTGLVENSSYSAQIVANVISRNGQLSATSPAATVGITTLYSLSTVKATPPSALKFSSVTPNALTASWAAPAGTIGKVSRYSIVVKQGSTVKATYSTTGTSYTLSGLNPNTAYTVEVRAVAVSANGLKQATSNVVTSAATTAKSSAVSVSAPTAALPNVASDKVTVSWTKPAVTGSITGYKVLVKTGIITVKTINVAASQLSTTVTGLNELTNYSFTVEANAVAENGINTAKTSSQVVTARTNISAGSAVTVSAPSLNATASAATATSGTITATWTKPAATGNLWQYRLLVKRNGVVVKWAYMPGFSTSYTFTGLQEKTGYTVEISAYAKSLNGKFQAISNTTTKAISTPTAQDSRVAVSTPSLSLASTPTSIRATWTRPAATGNLWQYRLIVKRYGVQVKWAYMPSFSTSYTFTGLRANAGYTVEITAYAKSLNGKFQAVSNTTTKAISTKR